MKTYLIPLFHYIVNDVLDALIYLPIGIAAIMICFFAVLMITWMLLGFEKRVSRNRMLRLSWSCVLFGYMVILLFTTIISRSPGSRTGVDLFPFSTIGNGPRNDAYVVENILLFIPFGFLLPIALYKVKKLWQSAGIGLLVSIAIETIQYLTKRGHAQTDDVIMNALGTSIGFLAICSMIITQKQKHLIQ